MLPAELRQQDNIEPGEEFDIERLERGEYRLKLRKPPRNAGLVKLLLACPVKGWFRPIESSDTTDDITPPKLG